MTSPKQVVPLFVFTFAVAGALLGAFGVSMLFHESLWKIASVHLFELGLIAIVSLIVQGTALGSARLRRALGLGWGPPDGSDAE